MENTADDSSSSGFSGSSSSSSLSGMEMLYKEPAANVVSKELATLNIVNGNHIRYDFTKNSTSIMYIEYDSKRSFLKTTTTVQELKNKSTLVSNRAYGRVYKYENIWVGDKEVGLPTSLENGTVGFKVNKTWISDSNANESLVTLQWFNTTWEPLDTEKTGEDTNYLYFESKTPGYSSFAISEYTGEVDKNGTQVKLQDTLIGLESAGKVGMNGNANNSKAQGARGVAKILMAISLPLFIIFVGYLIIKKKI
jgi:clumping factor A